MVNTRMISECGFYEIFNFAKEKYGVEWNPANDLFFKTGILRYRTIHEVHPAEMPSYFDFKFEKSSDISAEQLAAMKPIEKARIILLAFGEANGVTHSLMVDCT